MLRVVCVCFKIVCTKNLLVIGIEWGAELG